MFLVGIIWAVFAPLLLLLPLWAIYKVLGVLGWPDRWLAHWAVARLRLLRFALAALLVALPVVTIWQMDHHAFVQVCQQEGIPVIRRTAQTDGFFLDDSTANSFGQRYLQTEGFAWMEARSIYKRDAFVRYTRAPDGKVSEVEQATLTARYRVVTDPLRPNAHTFVLRTRILDTQADAADQEMARAAMVSFDGGRLKWVLGVYGTDDFPSVRTDNETWHTAYNLVPKTLHPLKAEPSAAR